MKKFMPMAVLSAAILMFSACSKEKYVFEYTMQPGETYVQNTSMDMNIVQEMMGQTLEMSTLMEMKLSYVVEDVKDEQIEMKFTIDKMRMDMDMGFSSVSIDSDASAEEGVDSQNLSPMFKSIVGIPVDYTMTKKGKFVSMNGLDAIFDAMLSSLPQTMSAEQKQEIVTQFGQQFEEKNFTQMMEQASSFFPEKPVAIGESWTSTMDLQGQVEMVIELKNTLLSVVDNVATVESIGTFSTGDNPVVQNNNGMEVTMSMNGSQNSVLKIDLNTGWTIGGEITQEMDNEVEAMGMKVPQRIVSKIVYLDK